MVKKNKKFFKFNNIKKQKNFDKYHIKNLILKNENYFKINSQKENFTKKFSNFINREKKIKTIVLTSIFITIFFILLGLILMFLTFFSIFLSLFSIFICGIFNVLFLYKKTLENKIIFFKYFEIFNKLVNYKYITEKINNYPLNIQLCFHFINTQNIPFEVYKVFPYFSYSVCIKALYKFFEKYNFYFNKIVI